MIIMSGLLTGYPLSLHYLFNKRQEMERRKERDGKREKKRGMKKKKKHLLVEALKPKV